MNKLTPHYLIMNKLRLLNTQFDVVSFSETLQWADQWIRDNKKGYLTTVNVAILIMMRSLPQLKQFIDQSALTVADGQPIVWASRLKRKPLPERVTGIDLIYGLCELAEKRQYRVYFLGAEDDTLHCTIDQLKKKYPHLIVAGFDNGYFPKEKAGLRAQMIRGSKTEILFVGMGVPRQETFLSEHWKTLNVNLAVPVGGSFDVIAGKLKRAPLFMQRYGLEWFYRLWQEPGRLWWRYLYTNTMFLTLLFVDLVRSLFSRQ